jgi:hypothetical protein
MRCTLTIVLTAIALACSEAREGIPFHTKSPTSAEPIACELLFTPPQDRFARMLVEKQFHVVTILDAVDPAVRRLWFKRYPRKDIATGNQPFAETDISDGAPFRFIVAGQTANTWFILFETGGLLRHHTLVFFQRASAGFRVAQAAYGNSPRNTFESCVDAVRNGKFVQADDLSRY